MKKYQILSVLLVLFFCISCESDEPVTKTELTATGLLCYKQTSDGWEIQEVIPNTIDAVNIYIVKKYNVSFPKSLTTNVQVTGLCYPSSRKIKTFAGTKVYEMEVKSLTFK